MQNEERQMKHVGSNGERHRKEREKKIIRRKNIIRTLSTQLRKRSISIILTSLTLKLINQRLVS